MSDLGGRIGRLEQVVREGSGPSRWRESLAPYFSEPVYDRDREALLDALCGPHPVYSFEAHGGADRGQYYVFWWTRSGPPVVMRVQRADGGA